MTNRADCQTDIAPCRSWRRPVAWVVLLALVLNPLLVLGQNSNNSEMVLRAGDQIRLTVPGRPDLDADLTLDPSGRAIIPQVGEVTLSGLTNSEATLFIKQKLRLFYPTIDSVHLEINRSGATKIYVMGQVARPGVQSFDHVPTIWDVMRSAGGPNASADLRTARVIREEDGMPKVQTLDLSGIIDGRSFPDFELRTGDTLIIPALLEGVTGVPAAEGVKVFGGVGVATVVPLEGPMPMLDVLMLAGAPSDEADLSKVYWVHEDGGQAMSTLVDLQLYLKEGNPVGNPRIYPGDTLHVKIARPGWFRANVPWVLGTIAAVITILLGYDRLINGDN